MASLSMGPIRLRTSPGWEVFHRYDITDDSFQLFARLVDHTGQRWAVNPLELTKVGHGVPAKPTMSTTRNDREDGIGDDINGFLQAAMDVAWEIGIRPTGADYTNANSEIAAVRYHLEDMRKLAKVK
jgi:hypothetical protein